MTAPVSNEPADLRATTRVPQRFWIGLLALVVYVALAGGVANLLDAWVQPSSEVGEFALTHFPVLIPLIVAGVVFVRVSGWGRSVWRTPAAFETHPRRWWMLAFPVLLFAQAVAVIVLIPWNDRAAGLVLVVALGTAMVGFGEELYVRGILRASLRAHHGETLTLVVTSLLFGAAHTLGSVMLGLQPTFIAFQVVATAFDGVLLYGVFRATGRLWVAATLHALTDFSLYVSNGDLADHSGSDVLTSPVNVVIQFALWALAAALLVSCIRQDLRARRDRRQTADDHIA
ncbi:CPBP family intramembrane glutamic endopeptidase [Agromyces silvae]|uniref:CPBP family intramembrane glutamic endopeptidase n=1 Tax=Agromyces silvae TaxID=3388266 RepID=UPI00280BBEAF|nr:type II CAAX endopeptidase family protein [Agromyces protaetiae]